MANDRRKWLKEVVEYFEVEAKTNRRVFTREQIAAIQNNGEIPVPPSMSITRFLNVMLEQGRLKKTVVNPEDRDTTKVSYKPFTRYIWDSASPYDIGLSLRAGGYLSHTSAVFLHGLTQQIPKSIYANKEQSPKPSSGSPLTQSSIDRAFRNLPRTSKYIYDFEGYRIILLSGKSTGNLEVTEIPGPLGTPILVTKLERTLIDIAVRPAYAGGVFDVAEAFRGARDRMSVRNLVATLKKLSHVYPYHQAIGFYMQLAGYSERDLAQIEKLGIHYNFYLANKIPNCGYSDRWKIYYPAELSAVDF